MNLTHQIFSLSMIKEQRRVQLKAIPAVHLSVLFATRLYTELDLCIVSFIFDTAFMQKN